MIILFLNVGLYAQTSNNGILSVSENTQFSIVERFDNLSLGEFYNDGETFIYNDFSNDGVLDFYENTGITKFIGSDIQNISGTQVSYLYNVLFNNNSSADPFHISGEINISGVSDFNQGIVDNDNFGGEITFNNGSSHINTSDLSHVDGFVNKFGDEDFIFPIGDGGYYRLAGTSVATDSDVFFTAKYFFENSDALYSHDSKSEDIQDINNQEYWTIEKANVATENGLVTLSWRTVTTPSSFVDAAQDNALTIVRWDSASNTWVDEGGAINLDDQTITTGVTNYGIFTLGRLNSDAEMPCALEIYNYVSPNGDGKNDFFFIDKTSDECARNLTVQVFNRWGVKVYETTNYGENGNVFDGHSSGRLTVKDSDKLPASTYYYILKYEYGSTTDSQLHKQAGFLYLSDN
ncbi:gliding motility-associated C-terminal domain-containing protein [Formosa agariphila]|uniref:gliding motility-associated C-terminal domain-containing protein n=1 Tax=Formosa agariphila TaxID=320324 RepID=UPI001F5A452E|nr:gliding motility-associated C-terminal domain-containing protein [Formosa agariphila]